MSRLRILIGSALAIALMCCASPGPAPSPAAPPDGRIYVMRLRQTLYGALPATVSIDGRTAGSLAPGTFLAVDAPAGWHAVTAAALMSHVRARVYVPPGGTDFLALTALPAGMPPRRGAILNQPDFGSAEPSGLFALRMLDPRAATALLQNLAPAR